MSSAPQADDTSPPRARAGPVVAVMLVDDDPILSESLRQLLDGSDGFICSNAYGSLEAAMVGLPRERADLVLLDVDLPGMSGPDGVREIRRRRPDLEIVMFTVYADEAAVFASLCNGACGYLLKDTPPERLLAALREARDGGAPMSSAIARQVIGLFRRVAPPPRADHDLTAQEVRLLGLLAEGHTYQAAAETLCISINTVRSHVRQIYQKLHVHSRSQAVHAALEQRIIGR